MGRPPGVCPSGGLPAGGPLAAGNRPMIERPALGSVQVPVSDSVGITRGGIAGIFRSPGPTPTLARMDRDYWTKALNEAEQELEAATTRSGLNAAAKKVMRAKQELKWLEPAKSSRRRSTRASGSAAASS